MSCGFPRLLFIFWTRPQRKDGFYARPRPNQRKDEVQMAVKKAAVIMGSDSDFPVVKKAIKVLKEFGIPVETHVYSAHRTPEQACGFAAKARDNGFGVIIAAAGKAAHLAGVLAAHTTLPVIVSRSNPPRWTVWTRCWRRCRCPRESPLQPLRSTAPKMLLIWRHRFSLCRMKRPRTSWQT